MVTMATQMYSNVFFYHIYVPYHNINFSLTWCLLKKKLKIGCKTTCLGHSLENLVSKSAHKN